MKNLINYDLGNGQTILIESDESKTVKPRISKSTSKDLVKASINSTSKSYDKITRNFSDAVVPIKAAAESLFKAFENISDSMSEIELELSLKVSAEGGFIITKGSIEGNFKVTLKWSKEKKNNK